MSKLTTIDSLILESVTGGGGNGSGDALLKDLSSLASSIKDLGNQTSSFNSTQMLLLVALAMRNQQPAASGVVYVGRPPRWW